MTEESGRLRRADGVELAWKRQGGTGPTVVFLPGFKSDMEGSKAVFLAAWAAETGRAFLRLDYSGHGVSGGAFEEGSIGRWTEDALAVIDALTEGPLLLVGSSMGGWIGLKIALARPGRVAAYVGIAAAPDFTETLIWATLPEAQRVEIMTKGVIHVPGDYPEPLAITRGLIEDGRRHLLLGRPIALDCPIRLLQGQQDEEVPWKTALAIAERVTGQDVRVVLVKDGNHRLSREADLALLRETVESLLA